MAHMQFYGKLHKFKMKRRRSSSRDKKVDLKVFLILVLSSRCILRNQKLHFFLFKYITPLNRLQFTYWLQAPSFHLLFIRLSKYSKIEFCFTSNILKIVRVLIGLEGYTERNKIIEKRSMLKGAYTHSV